MSRTDCDICFTKINGDPRIVRHLGMMTYMCDICYEDYKKNKEVIPVG